MVARLKAAVIIGAVLLTVCSYLNVVEGLFYNNDGVNNMAGGIAVVHPNPALDRLYEQNTQLCATAYSAEGEQRRCRDYQHFIRSDLFFAQPFYAFYGWRLAAADSAAAFPVAVHGSLFWAGFAQIVVGALLLALVLALLPAGQAIVLGGALIIGFISIWHVSPWTVAAAWPSGVDLLRIIGPLSGWAKPAALVVALCVMPALVRFLPTALRRAPAWLVPLAVVAAIVTYALQFDGLEGVINRYTGALLVKAGLSSDLYHPLVSLSALLLFGFLIAAAPSDLPASIKGICAVLLFFSLSTEPRSFWPHDTIWARQVLQLAFALWIAAASMRKSPGIAALALMLPLFHLAVSSMYMLIVAAGEAVFCLRNRRWSPLLIASLCGLAVTQLIMLALWAHAGENRVTTFGLLQLVHLAEFWRVLATAEFQASLASAAILAALGLWVLMRHPEQEPLMRAAYYVAVAIVVSALSKGLNAVPGFYRQFEPGVGAFLWVDHYLAPGLCLASVLMMLSAIAPARPAITMQTSRPALTIVLPLAALASLFVARLELKPIRFDSFVAAVHRFMDYGVADKMEARFSRLLGQFSLNDDVYFLSTSRPTNSPVVYMSVLKARIRDHREVLDPDTMRFILITEE